MWLYLNLLIVLFVPFALGAAVLSALLRERMENFFFWERIALFFSIGWGLHAIIMFILGLIKIPLTFTNILVAGFIIIAGLLPFYYKYLDIGIRKLEIGNWKLEIGNIVLAVIGLKVLFVAWSTLIKPIIDPDLLACYALSARMTFLNGTFPRGWPLADETLMPSLSQAWSAIGFHGWNDAILTIWSPFLFLGLVIIFYSALSRYFSRWYSLIFTFLLSTLPFLVFHAGTAYADFLQTFYYSTATIYLFLFMKEIDRDKDKSFGFLLISALLLGLAVWAKRSGIYYAGINIAAASVFLGLNHLKINQENWKKIIYAFVIFAIIITPWLTYQPFTTLRSVAKGAVLSIVQPPSETTSTYTVKPLDIIQAFSRNSFAEDNWHILGMVFLAALLLYPKTAFSSPRGYLLAIIGLQFAGLLFIFTLSNMSSTIFNETLLNRLMLHFVPVILYFCAEVIGLNVERTD
jgi:hypothetical protein